ncbi:BON domain-containing protein [Lysobacter terrae]
MNHRNEGGRHDHPSGRGEYGAGREFGQDGGNTLRGSPRQNQTRGQYGLGEQSDRDRSQYDRSRMQQPSYGPSNRSRGEYYAGGQSDDRMRSAGWEEDRGSWDYEGGPERFSATGYGEQEYSQGGPRRQYGSQSGGQRETSASGDYYRGRQGYGARGSHGNEYNAYGRNEGYGEGSAYTRQAPRGSQLGGESQFGRRGGARYGGESAGGRGSLYGSQDYLDEGEMSGYGGRELSSQQYGSSSSGRYGTAPGQYGYGGYGTAGYRGVGPKNYRRSDERLAEDINERLTDDDDLDATDISVRVADGKVTLDGTVDHRWMKHRAEDIADACIGVKEVDNRIQVSSTSSSLGQGSDLRSGSSRATQASQSGASPSSATGSTGTAGGTTPH